MILRRFQQMVKLFWVELLREKITYSFKRLVARLYVPEESMELFLLNIYLSIALHNIVFDDLFILTKMSTGSDVKTPLLSFKLLS